MLGDAPGRVTCQFCGLRPADRGRRLCYRCRQDPTARATCPPRGDVRGHGGGNRGTGLREPEPTAAPPGSPEKVEVLADRAERGERLWSDRDAKGV